MSTDPKFSATRASFASIRNAHILESLLEGASLESEKTALVKQLSRLPQLGVQPVQDARITGQTLRLSDTPGVAKHDVLPVPNDGISTHRVRMVGNEVAAPIVLARGMSPSTHWIDCAVIDTVVSNHAEQVVMVMVVGAIVLRLTAVDLCHGFDGVARVGDSNVRPVTIAATDPLGERLFIQRWPDVGPVTSTAIHRLAAGIGDGNLVVDLYCLSPVVIVAPFVVETHTETVRVAIILVTFVALIVGVHPRGTVDGSWVSPEHRKQSSDEPAVGGSALLGVVEVVLGYSATISDAEIGHVIDETPVDRLEKVVVHVTPRTIRRRPSLTVTVAAASFVVVVVPTNTKRGKKLIQSPRELTIGDLAGNTISVGVGVDHKADFSVGEASMLDVDLVKVLNTDLLQIAETMNPRKVRSDQVSFSKQTDVFLRQLFCTSFLLVEPEASKQNRVVLHVKEFIVIGL